MDDDKRLALICELAAWNGRFSATIEIALISFRHNNPDEGIKALERMSAEYETYRNAEYAKLTAGEHPHGQTASQTEKRHVD
jgi:hypothetical protein